MGGIHFQACRFKIKALAAAKRSEDCKQKG